MRLTFRLVLVIAIVASWVGFVARRVAGVAVAPGEEGGRHVRPRHVAGGGGEEWA